jgi:FdhD protein
MNTKLLRIDVSTGKAEKIVDCVAEEKPLHILINRVHYATITCSPSNLKELTIGHLLAEGLLKSVDEIEEISLRETSICHVKLKKKVDAEKRLKTLKSFSRVIFSACGNRQPYQFSGMLRKVQSNISVKAETLLNCVNRLNSDAETFRKTGGVHVASICKNDGGLVALAEDVGRHNAVDKVVGRAALMKVDLRGCFLVLSGRLSGDIVFKAAKVDIPIVASIAAALDSGIAIAKKTRLTLVGFVRGRRMNVYTFPERIIW